jgi:hypothetical protein
MVISRIYGGLGNQLFQYAAGRALALHHDTRLLLDVGKFDEYKLRHFDLAALHTELTVAKPDELSPYFNRDVLKKIRDNIAPMPQRKVFKQKKFRFDPRFFSLPANVYIQGYWQSEKFFAPIADVIRREFTLRDEHIAKVLPLAERIGREESVSVHIRRGDYANKEVMEMHGTLPELYYQEAIASLRERHNDLRFYIFSDDMQWVKDHLAVDNAEFVSGTYTSTHFEDFYLMSRCRHNIIANSSFSWWAAWLNPNPAKTVIAPQQWFGNKGPRDTQDLFPAGWTVIPCS